MDATTIITQIFLPVSLAIIMFGRASNFNQLLNSWSVSNVTDCKGFDTSVYNWDLPKPNFTNCN